MGWYDRKVRRVRDLSCGDTRIFLELEVRRVECRRCGTVKRERLDFLADNPLYTKRFAYYVGRRCRSATIKDVAAELKLDWHTVKTRTVDPALPRHKNSRRWRDAPIDKRCNLDRRIVVVCCPELERVRPVIVRGSTAPPSQVHQ